jgi:ribosome-binding factor A
MASRRQRQVAELLHEEISRLMQHNTRDPRLGFVTVTGVDVSPDLRNAKVYVTVLGDKEDQKETLAGLASATGFYRYQLKQDLSLRYIPELKFQIDTSLEYGLHIEKLLDSIQEEPENLPEIDHSDEN